jgi:5-methylcytosine-specific restriction endonuclease McrA
MEANRELHRAFDAKRKAAKKNRTPEWLTEDHEWMMRETHELALRRTKITGVEWEVDHILPISGETVSGLHVPWNLQVVTRAKNRAKSNKLPSEEQFIGGGW